MNAGRLTFIDISDKSGCLNISYARLYWQVSSTVNKKVRKMQEMLHADTCFTFIHINDMVRHQKKKIPAEAVTL